MLAWRLIEVLKVQLFLNRRETNEDNKLLFGREEPSKDTIVSPLGGREGREREGGRERGREREGNNFYTLYKGTLIALTCTVPLSNSWRM